MHSRYTGRGVLALLRGQVFLSACLMGCLMLLEHAEVGGLWAETGKVDGAQCVFDVDASGGS